ncbi:MAG: cyclic nucleotide-binding domain-containing protein [Actinomycetota bacterium]|nr:cyclic nucleotide-binding domain-containing protein [Actinomycetota bacterium]
MNDIYGFRKAFTAGQAIVREGDSGDEMYIVRSGKVRVSKGSGADSVTLAVLGSGEFFGEMALMGEYKRSATATAETDTTLTVVDKQTFSAFVSEPIVHDIMSKMAQRIRQLDEKVVDSERSDQSRRAHLGSIVEQRHWFV